jgi:hypothetical protein
MSLKKYKEYRKEELFKILLALVAAIDSDLLDNRRCFPCNSKDHATWKWIRDAIQDFYVNYDYVESPEFLNSIKGKSDSYQSMAKKIASSKNHEKRKDFYSALTILLESDDVFQLTATDKHEILLAIRDKINSMYDDAAEQG